MKLSPDKPISLRVNEDDIAVLEELQQLMGLKSAQLLKLGLRTLLQQQRRLAKE